MKTLFTFLFFSISSLSFAQEIVFEHILPRSSFTAFKENYFIENNKENILFYKGKEDLLGIKLDNNFQLLQQYKTSVNPMNSHQLLGNSYSANTYTLFFTNKNFNVLYAKSINFNRRDDSEIILLELDSKNEKILESISLNNKFYVLTLSKKNSDLNIYEFIGDNLRRNEHFPLKKYKDGMNRDKSLFSLLIEVQDYFRTKLDIVKVSNSSETSIEVASMPIKLFSKNNKIIITINTNKEKTEIIEIDLESFVKTEKKFQNPICNNQYFIQTNSFILNDKVFLLSASDYELKYSILNYLDNSILKMDSFLYNEEIKFNNTHLIRDGNFFQGNINNKRKTMKFLRLLSKSNIGISAFENKIGNFLLTFGGVKEINNYNGFSSQISSSSYSSSGGYTVTSSSYYYNNFGYNSWLNKRTEAVFFKTKLNSSLNYSDGELTKSLKEEVFSFIQKQENLEFLIKLEEIYQVSDFLILSYFDKIGNKFILRKFTEE